MAEVDRREDRRELAPGILVGRELARRVDLVLEFLLIGLVVSFVGETSGDRA